MSPLDAARAALAEREGPACDALLFDDPDIEAAEAARREVAGG